MTTYRTVSPIKLAGYIEMSSAASGRGKWRIRVAPGRSDSMTHIYKIDFYFID